MLSWTVLIFVNVIIRVANSGCIITINILINNSVPQEMLGIANGVGMTCACVGRSELFSQTF